MIRIEIGLAAVSLVCCEEDDEDEEEPMEENTYRIAIYCHKGKHRSVAFAEELKERLASDSSIRPIVSEINVTHRDVHKNTGSDKSSEKNVRRNQKSSFRYFDE